MSSFQLFRKRLRANWNYQSRIFLLVADWTIWLYILIPSLVIAIFIYRSWWIEPAPNWIEWVPLSVFLLIGYLLSWDGGFRTYIEEADKVFLLKNKQVFSRLKTYGLFYSLLFQFVTTIFVVLMMLPFMLVHYRVGLIDVGFYFLYLLGVKYGLILIKFLLRKLDSKWRRMFITVALFLLLAWVTQLLASFQGKWGMGVMGLLFGISGIFLLLPQVKKLSNMEMQFALEQEAKLRLVNLIYLTSFDIEKPKIYAGKKPWLFRNSRKIFKKRSAQNGFLELYLKIFLRNSTYLTTYLQICSVTVIALLVVPPIWIKVLIFAGFSLMMWAWLEGTWERIVLSHPFSKKYVEKADYFSARKIVILCLFFLALIFIVAMVSVGLWIYRN